MVEGGVAGDDRPRLGRPPRINREMIAEAAHDLGLERLTLRDVASHLGVSVAALYHYVSGKDDLLRLAAEYSAARVPLPEDHGQHWALWLLEWATYNRDAFVARPGLLAQFLEGAISPEVIAPNVDTILGLLVRQGFSISDANAAYELVSECALGAALTTIREREAEAAGTSIAARHREVFDRAGPDEYPYFRDLVRSGVRASFETQVTTVLIGIAVRRGEDWKVIARRIDRVLRRGTST